MKAQQLRIGNIFKEKYTGDILMVSELTKDRITFDYQTENKWQVEPILLTEEILLKCGIVKDIDNGTIWIDLQTHYLEFLIMPDGFYPTYTQCSEIRSEFEQRVSLNKISHLHQLQNLYHALTGHELEVSI